METGRYRAALAPRTRWLSRWALRAPARLCDGHPTVWMLLTRSPAWVSGPYPGSSLPGIRLVSPHLPASPSPVQVLAEKWAPSQACERGYPEEQYLWDQPLSGYRATGLLLGEVSCIDGTCLGAISGCVTESGTC